MADVGQVLQTDVILQDHYDAIKYISADSRKNSEKTAKEHDAAKPSWDQKKHERELKKALDRIRNRARYKQP